jgi:hypothetical protein
VHRGSLKMVDSLKMVTTSRKNKHKKKDAEQEGVASS